MSQQVMIFFGIEVSPHDSIRNLNEMGTAFFFFSFSFSFFFYEYGCWLRFISLLSFLAPHNQMQCLQIKDHTEGLRHANFLPQAMKVFATLLRYNKYIIKAFFILG